MKKLLTLAIIMIAVTIVSCKKEKTTNDNSEPPIVVVDSTLLPQVQTLYLKNITEETAECVAKIVNWDSVALTEWGFCWSTSHNPTINDNTVQSTVIFSGVFGGLLTNLTYSATYYVRAYAQNRYGLVYGNEIDFVAVPHDNPWAPEPVDGHIPSEVLPDELAAEIGQYMNIYSGENPKIIIENAYRSHPHKLIHTTFDEPADTIYHDYYFEIRRNFDNVIDLVEYIWDENVGLPIPTGSRSYIIGSGDDFTIYYLKEDYTNGYAKTATILSGTWDEENDAVNNFKMAEILLKTFENPNLPPENSYRIIGDADSVSNYYPYFGK